MKQPKRPVFQMTKDVDTEAAINYLAFHFQKTQTEVVKMAIRKLATETAKVEFGGNDESRR